MEETVFISKEKRLEYFRNLGRQGGLKGGAKNKKKGSKYFKWIRSFGNKKKK